MYSTKSPNLAGILGIVFVTLKLMGFIDWSWWWVLSPFWIPLVLSFVFFALITVLSLTSKE